MLVDIRGRVVKTIFPELSRVEFELPDLAKGMCYIRMKSYGHIGTYGNSEELYSGKVVAYGIGVGYQRFHWKNLYTTVQATPFLQQYYDTEDEKIQNGFMLYLQLRLGYRFEFFNKRVFLEPSIVCNYWPVNTNVPQSFAEVNNGTPNYFLFEPGLSIGFKF